MERTDAIVALVGALVLVAALGVAAVSEAPPAAYALTFAPLDEKLPGGTHAEQAKATGAGTFDFTLDGTGLAQVEITVRVSFVGGNAQSARVTLTSPTGEQFGDEASANATGPAGAQAVVRLLVPISPAPENRTLAAASEAEARAQADALASTAGQGKWELRVDYSSGVAPAATVNVAWEGAAQRWQAQVSPDQPAGK